jgi:hypothetical protein
MSKKKKNNEEVSEEILSAAELSPENPVESLPEKPDVDPEKPDYAEYAETPESKAAHFGMVGFQKLYVKPEALTIGNGTYDFIAVPNGADYEGDILHLKFQNGIPAEVGINGFSNETVLRAVLNRLRSFQKGDFHCEENNIAISNINAALSALCGRTAERMKRNAEGKAVK